MDTRTKGIARDDRLDNLVRVPGAVSVRASAGL